MSARALRSNYTLGRLGSLFFGGDGYLYVLTASPNRKTLARVAPDGTSSVVIQADVLVGSNLRAAAPYGDGYVLALDYAPGSGSALGGIYRLAADGTYSEWGLTEGHGGVSDLIPAPQGGYYFTDFENDNLWFITAPGQPERALLSSSPVALWSVAASQTGDICAVNWVPGEWWSNGGVNGVYRIAGDAAGLAVAAPEGSRFHAVAAGAGGLFGTSFYVTDELGGRVLRLEADNTLTPVITGLPSPSRLRFDPRTGDLVVLCENQYLLWFGAGLQPFAAPPEDSSFKGLFFSDFENDNLWLVPGEGAGEIPIIDSGAPPGLAALAYNDLDHTVYAINMQGSGWPFGGEDAVYAIHPNGASVQVCKGVFGGIAMGPGGPLGRALYVSDGAAGAVCRLDGSALTPVVTGLPAPGPLAFDPRTGNLVVVCDAGRQVAWIGTGLPGAAAGDPGTVGPYFVPPEQASADIAASAVEGSVVTLSLQGSRPGAISAYSKVALSGDFDVAATIRMSAISLTSGQTRSAIVYVVSDVAGRRDDQLAYVGILQKTVGFGSTGGEYRIYSDMRVDGGWGRFVSMPLAGPPEGRFRILRRAGVITTYYLQDGAWTPVGAFTDGFADRVRLCFQIDTSWDASMGTEHQAMFAGPDFGGVGGTPVLEEHAAVRPEAVALAQNYPNPFNAVTQIRFAVPAPGPVDLAVFDLKGQRVATLVSGTLAPGTYAATWDGRDSAGRAAATAVYVYRLETGATRESRRLLLLR